MMSDKRAKALLEKYKTDGLSEEESALVEQWLFKYQNDGVDLSEEMIADLQKEVWGQLQIDQIKPKQTWLRIIAAACVLFVLGTGVLVYMIKVDSRQIQIVGQIGNDIIPGGNKAILTLSNGKRISLTDAGHGELAKQSGIRISKTIDGKLVYQVTEDVAEVGSKVQYNTVETPRGGQYQVNLPDGSKVWLNAATVLKFPLSFNSLNERRVELIGEAYFEVEKDEQKPFIVQSNRQLTKVLGTHFNICSYADELNTKTTLVEGSIKIVVSNSSENESRVLIPGQQAQTSSKSDGIRVANVDVQSETSWKNGFFSFEDAPIETIMKQIARWYDVEVIYKDDLSGKNVWGSVTRYDNVSKVLSILEKTGRVHFKIEGRRIIVSK